MYSRSHLHIALALLGLLGLSMLAGCSKGADDQSGASAATPAVKDQGGVKPAGGSNASTPQAPTFDTTK